MEPISQSENNMIYELFLARQTFVKYILGKKRIIPRVAMAACCLYVKYSFFYHNRMCVSAILFSVISKSFDVSYWELWCIPNQLLSSILAIFWFIFQIKQIIAFYFGQMPTPAIKDKKFRDWKNTSFWIRFLALLNQMIHLPVYVL